MRPPTDSLRHEPQKLAEAQTNRTSSTSAPPFLASSPRTSPLMMDDPKWEDPATPITITIDSTIDVFGNNNTVMLPSRIAPSTSTTPRPSTNSENFGSSTPSTSKQIRAANVGSTAGIIIAALKQAGGLIDDPGRIRPIHLSVSSGIKIDGKSNTICNGYTQPTRVITHSTSVAVGEKRRAVSV